MKKLVAATVLLLVGCVPVWHGVFINASDRTLNVTLVNEGTREARSSFALPPGERQKQTIAYDKATVTDETGGRLFEQELPLLDPEHRYGDEDERSIYFLITERGVYRVPKQYRRDWEVHIDEIIAEGQVDS